MFGAIASLAGSLISSSAAGDAAQTQANATNAATGEQQREYDINRGDLAPYRNAGTNALSQLMVLMGLQPNRNASPTGNGSTTPDYPASYGVDGPNGYWARPGNGQPDTWVPYPTASSSNVTPDANFGELTKKFSIADFWNDPVVKASYQAGLDLGTKALKNAAPLTTGLDSGAALKELTKFGTDYTGNMAAGSQARYVADQANEYNRLAGLAGTGQTAATATGQLGSQAATNISNLQSAQGNASAASQIAQGNAWAGGLNSVANWWNQQQMLNRVNQPPAWTPSGQWWGTTENNF